MKKTLNTNTWNRLRYTLYMPAYDLVGRLFTAGRRTSIANLNLQPGQRVLLVGAGTGLDLELLPEGIDVTATDITPVMVGRIRRRAERLGRPVTAQVMDGHALEYDDHSFDAVILHLVLAVIPDPYACLSEAARVLKPGGCIAVYDKFLPEGEAVSSRRSIMNAVAGFLFSEINRQLEPIVAAVPELTIIRDDTDTRFGAYRIVLLRKAS